MEKYPKVTCEVCGQREIVDTQQSRNIYKATDLWICEHCVYVYNFIDNCFKQAHLNINSQNDRLHLVNTLAQIEKTALLYPLYNPLPRINNVQPCCNRIDSLIVEEDI